MKIKDFDFRIWNNGTLSYERFITDTVLNISKGIRMECTRYTKDNPRQIIRNSELELFTGQRDLNHIKIFEGDILGHFNAGVCEYKTVVTFNPKLARFELVEVERGIVQTFETMSNKKIIIIGNKNENKELLGMEQSDV